VYTLQTNQTINRAMNLWNGLVLLSIS